MSAVAQRIEPKINPRIETSDGFSVRKINIKDYEEIIDIGIFDEGDRAELLDGVIAEISPRKTKHANIKGEFAEFLIAAIAGRAVVRNQNPIVFNDFSEPDVVMARPPRSNYADAHPTAEDTLLVVEAADATVIKDRGKAFNHARVGIIQYLLFNLNASEVEDYREPAADAYRFKQTHDRTANFNLVAFPEVKIRVADLLPPDNSEATE